VDFVHNKSYFGTNIGSIIGRAIDTLKLSHRLTETDGRRYPTDRIWSRYGRRYSTYRTRYRGEQVPGGTFNGGGGGASMGGSEPSSIRGYFLIIAYQIK